jgi:prefoldin subunit 5
METVVNMIEVQRGQDVASIEKLNTQVAGLQDQINKLPKTSGSGTDYSAQINTINQQITSINQLIGTINQVEAGIKTRLSTLENAQIKP